MGSAPCGLALLSCARGSVRYLITILPMVFGLRSLPSGDGFGVVLRVLRVIVGVKISSSSLMASVRI